jgi:CSLREA domain-containing protein
MDAAGNVDPCPAKKTWKNLPCIVLTRRDIRDNGWDNNRPTREHDVTSSVGCLRRFFMLAALIGALAVLAAPAASAAIINVNTTNDELNSDGNCSLREAIQASNTDTAVDNCTKGSGTDTINIPASGSPYQLSLVGTNEDANVNGDLDITDPVTINGAGPTQTVIDGNGAVTGERVIDLLANANISGVTVENGTSPGQGGGIQVHGGISGAVNLDNVVISNNASVSHGGGIDADGATNITNSTLSGNMVTGTAQKDGGAMDADAPVSLTNVMVTGNHVDASSNGFGGGLALYGGATVDHVTVTGNSSTGQGGGIDAGANPGKTTTITNSTIDNNTTGGFGGGVYSGGHTNISNSTISNNRAVGSGGTGGGVEIDNPSTLTNVTVSGNSSNANGGGLAVYEAATLNNVTVTNNTANADNAAITGDNGGGVSLNTSGPQTVSMSNTIISGNRVGTGGNNPDCSVDVGTPGPFSSSHDLYGNAGNCPTSGTDLVGAPANLGPLADNGGGLQTHALLAGSAARDAGDNSTCAPTDERGTARPQGPACDIGAFELSVSSPSPTSPSPTSPSPTGQRGAVLASCKKRAHMHHWSHKRLKRCKRSANLLPV